MDHKTFAYDEFSDSLIISSRQENEVVRENFEVGDIIFSLTGKGKIVSIEIRGASSFLESCSINPGILKNLKNAELKIIPRKETIFIVMKIESSEGTRILSREIPLILPLIR